MSDAHCLPDMYEHIATNDIILSTYTLWLNDFGKNSTFRLFNNS